MRLPLFHRQNTNARYQSSASVILFLILTFTTYLPCSAQRYGIKSLVPSGSLSEDRIDVAFDINEFGSVVMYSIVNSAAGFVGAAAAKFQSFRVSPNDYLPAPRESFEMVKSRSATSANLTSNRYFYLIAAPEQPGVLIQPLPGKSHAVFSLDNAGTPVGYADSRIFLDGNGFDTFLAAYWTQSTAPNFIDLAPRYIAGEAREASFNNRFIVGEMYNRDTEKWHAFLWDKTNPSATKTSTSNSYGAAVNSRGEVVGQKDGRAYAWNTAFAGFFLNAPGAALTEARKINDAGQIIVDGTFNGKTGSYLYENGNLIPFSDTFDVIKASNLNNNGEVVGAARKSDGGVFAFVWSKADGMKNLNEAIREDSGWQLTEATGINDKGQIIGYGDLNGKLRSFVLDLEEMEPLIFVPGIGGSTLNTAGGPNIWLGGSGILSDFSQLTLDPSKPQQTIIAGDALRKVEPFNKYIQDVYEPLLNMLTTRGGYKEYQVNNNPARRTSAGCDLSQRAANPTLFVFAYDWRKSNIENARLLKDYVGCVQKFYPNKKIDILAHSMGGLLSRRYTLDNAASHQINKLITVGSPFLGAPKSVYLMETGEFFDNFILDRIYQNAFKGLTAFFPGAHELLPGQSYYNLAGSYFGEAPNAVSGQSVGSWDINENGRTEAEYTHADFVSFFDAKRFPQSLPSQIAAAFHNRAGQDDWRQDQTGVEYFHIYGIQYRNFTVGKVIAGRKRQFDGSGNPEDVDKFFTVNVPGDGTVPEINASKIGNNQNLNAPGARLIPFKFNQLSGNLGVEYNGLTQNATVHKEIMSVLRTSNQPQSFYRTADKNNAELQSAAGMLGDGESYFL